MKKLIIMAALFFAAISPIQAQSTWNGNTIVAVTQKKTAEKTPYNFQAKDGKTYPIYVKKKISDTRNQALFSAEEMMRVEGNNLWTQVDEYKVKDDKGNDVTFGTYVPNI